MIYRIIAYVHLIYLDKLGIYVKLHVTRVDTSTYGVHLTGILNREGNGTLYLPHYCTTQVPFHFTLVWK